MTTTEDRPAGTGPGQDLPAAGAAETSRLPAELPAPEERGSLEVSRNVVRKVAQRVADHTAGTLRRGTGGRRGSSATVDGTGSTVDIVLDLALRYPASVREITEEVRRQVSHEVRRITGYHVRAVNVTVSALFPEIRSRVR